MACALVRLTKSKATAAAKRGNRAAGNQGRRRYERERAGRQREDDGFKEWKAKAVRGRRRDKKRAPAGGWTGCSGSKPRSQSVRWSWLLWLAEKTLMPIGIRESAAGNSRRQNRTNKTSGWATGQSKLPLCHRRGNYSMLESDSTERSTEHQSLM